MNVFQTEILQQGEALRANAALHDGGRTSVALSGLAVPKRVLLTGMGASFHAAIWGSHLLQRHDIWAMAAESSELLYYSGHLLQDVDCIVVVSQSGSSAEIAPLLDMAPDGVTVIGITNRPDSPLGARADRVLSIEAGEERVVATKTYLNTLACLWFLTSHWSSRCRLKRPNRLFGLQPKSRAHSRATTNWPMSGATRSAHATTCFSSVMARIWQRRGKAR